MTIIQKGTRHLLLMSILLHVSLTVSGCANSPAPKQTDETEDTMILLPELNAVDLAGEPLKVVASTSIIGDVVAQVGGDAIALTTLMEAGQDPHAYEPGARELTAVADADIIFVNGWDLEEALADDLAEISDRAIVVPISANIEPSMFRAGATEPEEGDAHQEGADEHAPSSVDPHVWFKIQHVEQWTQNAAHVLSQLDPANAEIYERNATAYLEALAALDAYAADQLGQIPEENRFMVTNHNSLGYFAQEYGLELIGTIIPGASTLAEPSANDLTELIKAMQEHELCTIFTETTVSDTLAQTVTNELSNCDDIKVVKLYTGSIGSAGTGAESYIGMFRANVDAVVEGLR